MEKNKPKIFEGVYREQMPLLVASYSSTTAEQVSSLRLGKQLSFDVYYDTVTGVFYSGDNQNRFKILPFSEDLARVNEDTPLHIGGIQKTQEQFDSSSSPIYTREDMILGRRLKEQEALTHKGWLEALNNNKRLLERVVSHVFKQVKDRYKEDEAMSFCLRAPQKIPNIHALCLYGLDGRCNAGDGYALDDGARLVGVRKTGETGSEKISCLENSIVNAIESRKPFKTKGGIYVFVSTDELKSLR